MSARTLRIFGIDPGSRVTGFGVLEVCGERVAHLNHGIIDLSDEAIFAHRLLGLGESLKTLLQKHQPHYVVVEKIFLGKNPQSAFQLGHARGVILAEGARVGAQIAQYTPRSVKKTLTGLGASKKEEVARALTRLLQLKQISHLDASDALALAWHQSQVLLEQTRVLRASL